MISPNDLKIKQYKELKKKNIHLNCGSTKMWIVMTS